MNKRLSPITVLEHEENGDAIYHYPIKADGSAYLAPIRLCEAFSIVGQGTDKAGLHYHVIKYGNGQHDLIARGDVGTNEGWRKLRNILNIPSQRRKLDLLTEYIQDNASKQQWKIPDDAGWHDNTYILPNGEIIGNNEHIFFNGKISEDKKRAYSSAGTLFEWQTHIAQYIVGNSRLALIIGAAFAAPFLKWLNIEGGIIHIYGQSTGGKTTIQRAAQSVWGHGQEAAEDWDSTAYALTNSALACNDGLISLDEISKDSSGDAVKHGIYALTNGKGRTRGDIDKGNRPTARFRVLGISTDETDLENHLKKFGKEAMAGELVRCPSIPHKLENHHHFTDMRAFTTHLNHASSRFYGTAGRYFMQKITDDTEIWKQVVIKRFNEYLDVLQKNHDLNDQNARTARLFATAMMGVQLACQTKVLPLDEKPLLTGIEHCFIDWLGQQPNKESYEDYKILKQASDFMQTNSMYFLNLETTYDAPPPFVSLGFVKKGEEEDEFYLYPAVFTERLCKGFDKNKVTEVLAKASWLKRAGYGKRWQKKMRYRGIGDAAAKQTGHFYVLKGAQPDSIDNIFD